MADPTREEIDAAKAVLLNPPPRVLTAQEIAAAEIAAEKEAARLKVHNDALREEAERHLALCEADPAQYTPAARCAFAAAGMQGDPRAVRLRSTVKLADGRTRAEAEAAHAEKMRAKRGR